MCESSQEWPDWKQHFKRFRRVIKFNAKGEVLQINVFIYTMYKEAEQIFKRLSQYEPPTPFRVKTNLPETVASESFY